MKKIAIVVACYNEVENIKVLIDNIRDIFRLKLSKYEYEIICIDNDSNDGTQSVLRKLCAEHQEVKAIFNARNFGSIRSSTYGMLQAQGDCIIKMCADFQDPPELIIDFIEAWENGTKLVLAIKDTSEEKRIKYLLRKIYYRCMSKITEIDHIDNFMGYGLYDKSFIDIIREINDPLPYLRGMVAEFGFKYKSIYYRQPKRRAGKSKFNLYRLYDYAMLGITSYSKVPLRMATFIGAIMAMISFLIGLVYLIMKLFFWEKFVVGMAPVVIGVFFLGAMQLLFIGLLGEYILMINTRVLRRPLVVEEERINFEDII